MILLLCLVACSIRPTDVTAFDGCWHEGTHLVATNLARGLILQEGDAAVLTGEADWGGSWLMTDQEQFASLGIEVRAAPSAGQVIDLHWATAQYREGGLALSYETTKLEGTLEIVAVDADSVQVKLDAMPVAPNLDTLSTPPIALQGTFTVKRGTGPACR